MANSDTLFPPAFAQKYNFVSRGTGWSQYSGKDTNGISRVSKFSSYYERGADWHSSGPSQTKVGNPLSDWNNALNIAPITPDQKDMSIEARTNHPNYIFLDCGRWKGTARDFGLVWGRHVYLCSYQSKSANTQSNSYPAFQYDPSFRDGLDLKFLKGCNTNGFIKIQAYTCADWGLDTDYNWDQVCVIIPDLHLMSISDGTTWYKWLPPQEFKYKAEVDLMYFAEDIIANTSLSPTQVKIVQIGDLYDLWVDCWQHDTGQIAPWFTTNNSQQLIVDSSHYADIIESIGAIQNLFDGQIDTFNLGYLYGINYFLQYTKLITDTEKIYGWKYLNPAEGAIRRLQNTFGDNMIFIYGNHDNYLIDAGLTRNAKLKQRLAFWDDGASLFIEHGHRMEALFHPIVFPTNEDGVADGWSAANGLYLAELKGDKDSYDQYLQRAKGAGADLWAGYHDQSAYKEEFARFWFGRKSNAAKPGSKNPPSIFAIGHTHMPELYNLQIRLDIQDFIQRRTLPK